MIPMTALLMLIVGAQPGTVEMIDLGTRRRVGSVDVGQMAEGIDFWKREP